MNLAAPPSATARERLASVLATLSVLACAAYRAATKAHHEANPQSGDQVYEQLARGLWEGGLPPGDFSPGLAPFLALFANPWTGSEAAFAGARFVLVVVLALCTQRAVRPFAGPWIAAAVAVWLAASPVAFARFVSRPAAACIVAGALALAARPRGEGAALCALALGTWLRPEFYLAAAVLAATGAARRRVSGRAALCAVMFVLSSAAFRARVEGRYEDRLFRAFAQHYAWGAKERGTFEGDPWSGWREPVERDFGAGTRGVGDAVRAAPLEVARHVAHNVVQLPREAVKALRPFDGGGPVGFVRPGVWLTLTVLGTLAACAAATALRRGATACGREVAALLRDAAAPLSVALAAASMVLPWLLVRPRADVLFTLAPGALFVLALVARYAFGRSPRDVS